MKFFPSSLISILLITQVACGGGGGGDDPNFNVNLPPVAQAPDDFSVIEGIPVILSGATSVDPDGSIVSYLWVQSGGSPSVSLSNSNSAVATFIAPAVTQSTQLTFTLTVTDNDNEQNTESVIVTINPDLPPQANAGNDFDGVENTSIELDGSASSDDVAIVSYQWQQTAGDSVNLSNSDSETASFTAPAYNPAQAQTFTFQLTVTDIRGATDTDEVTVTIIETPAVLTLSGQVTFDLVRHNTVTNGLNHAGTSLEPVKGATIELLNASNSSLVTASTTDANGQYSFEVSPMTSYKVRVKAELKQQGMLPSWDMKVVDNTSSQALYAMDSPTQTIQQAPVVLNLNADSGWGTNSYTSARVAAPFAILDSVYQSVNKVIVADPTVAMTPLKINWSVNNIAVEGNTEIGEIITSHFNGSEIFILGDADSDTDEYDDHVIVHEWGHYLEAFFSRSDSLGGSHSGSDKLDLRVAVSEGFGNALSAIVTDDAFYRDSFGTAQSEGFEIDIENNPATNRGWYSEFSVQSLLYDIYDADADGADNLALGFTPIYAALSGGQKTTDTLTSIFSLVNQIKLQSAANASAIDALAASQNIIAADDYGSTETNDGGDPRNLPVYKTITIGGSSVAVCSHGTYGDYNKLGNHQFIRFEIVSAGNYQFVANGTSGSNPEIEAYRKGSLVFASRTSGNESTTRALTAGQYVLDVFDRGNIDGTAIDSCINVSISSI